MKSILKLDPDQQSPACSCCVYSRQEGGSTFCTKQKKQVQPADCCPKFDLDILAKAVPRKRPMGPKKTYDFSID